MKRCFLFILLRYYSSSLIVSYHSKHNDEFHFELQNELLRIGHFEFGTAVEVNLSQNVTQKAFQFIFGWNFRNLCFAYLDNTIFQPFKTNLI